jgi:hypothetical protein
MTTYQIFKTGFAEYNVRSETKEEAITHLVKAHMIERIKSDLGMTGEEFERYKQEARKNLERAEHRVFCC